MLLTLLRELMLLLLMVLLHLQLHHDGVLVLRLDLRLGMRVREGVGRLLLLLLGRLHLLRLVLQELRCRRSLEGRQRAHRRWDGQRAAARRRARRRGRRRDHRVLLRHELRRPWRPLRSGRDERSTVR